MQVQIKELVEVLKENNALLQTEATVVPAIDGANPYPLLVTKSAGHDGETHVHVDTKADWAEYRQGKRDRTEVIEAMSFINYVNRHKEPRTEIVMDSGRVVATIDANAEGPEGTAGFGRHTCELKLDLTRDAQKWIQATGKTFGQTALAEFLEDMDHTIIEPQAADVRDIVMSLQGKTDVAWKSRRNLDDGTVQLQYEENGVTGGVTFPHSLRVAVQLHQSVAPTDFQVRLSYRMKDGDLTFGIKVIGMEKAIEDSELAIRELIEEQTGLQVFR